MNPDFAHTGDTFSNTVEGNIIRAHALVFTFVIPLPLGFQKFGFVSVTPTSVKYPGFGRFWAKSWGFLDRIPKS